MKFKDSAGIFHDIGMKFKDGSGVWHNVGAKFKDNEGIWRDVYPPVAEELILLGAPGTAANWTLSGSTTSTSYNGTSVVTTYGTPTMTKSDTRLYAEGGGGGYAGGGVLCTATCSGIDFSQWKYVVVNGYMNCTGNNFISTRYIKINNVINNISNSTTPKELTFNITEFTTGTLRFNISSSSSSANSGGGITMEITSVKLIK